MTVAQMSAFISFPAGEPDLCREKMRGLIIRERESERGGGLGWWGIAILYVETGSKIYLFSKGN